MVKKQQKHEMLTYAIAKDGRLVHVDDVETGQKCACTCPACGEALIAKNNGIMRVHHFAHKSGVECEFAHESMLHLLAKERIQKAFLNSKSFWIDYEYTSYCPNYNQCKFKRYGDCFMKKKELFNLKDDYDCCEQEAEYDGIGGRSDLKIYSSSNLEIEPIYIEFCVTHASDLEKLHSGKKIIECVIESEEDIKEIVRNGFIEDEQIDENFSSQIASSKRQFYGFWKKRYDNNEVASEIVYSRYILFESGKVECAGSCSVDCNVYKKEKLRQDSLYEVHFHSKNSDKLAKFAKCLAYARFPIRNCFFCKNYVDKGINSACKYKYKMQVRAVPFMRLDTSVAETCDYYTFNQEEYDQIMQEGCGVPYDEIF